MAGFTFKARPQLVEALALLCPGSSYQSDVNPDTGEYDYEHVTFHHSPEEYTPPTKEVVMAYLEQIQAEWDEKCKYRELRAWAYPPVEELADAIYWQAQGDNTKMDAYLAQVAAVKEEFAKNDPTLPWRGSALGTIKGSFPGYGPISHNPNISLPDPEIMKPFVNPELPTLAPDDDEPADL